MAMSAWLFAGFMVALAVWLAWAQFYGGDE